MPSLSLQHRVQHASMFNIGTGEIALIAVVALLVLGPKRLPELARGLGKFLREFRKQTDDIRHVVEREFYKMDEDFEAPPSIRPAEGTKANTLPEPVISASLPAPSQDVSSQVTAGTSVSIPVENPEKPKDS